MKKLLGLVCAGAVVAMMSGCGLVNPQSTPTITIDAIGSIDVGTYKDVTGKIEASEAITSVSYSVTTSADAAASGITVTGPTSSSTKTLNFTATSPVKITVASTAAAGSYKLKISATAGATGEGTFNFTVAGGATLLAVTASDGKIANVMGPDLGAYDLVNSARVASSGAASSKDLLDLSLAGQGFAGSIGTGNGAKFAAATATDYTGATAASVKTLGDAATASTIAIAANTVFAVKLGNSRGYAIVKILTYDPNAGASTGNNKGEATFEYKFTAN
jgi:hypothetical protein